MSGAFSIRKPSVLATLPRPIDTSTGQYVVSDVHGGIPGSRKRKRGELAVGIDGEGLNIYDIRSTKLVTSYALPPLSFFTCSPCSIRIKNPKKGDVERRTYVSSVNTTYSITLFRDSTTATGLTSSEVVTHNLSGSNGVVFMTTVSDDIFTDNEHLLLVRKDGEIQCLDGLDLELRWSSAPTAISRHTSVPYILDFEVDFTQVTDAYSASKGLLKNRKDTLAAFSKVIAPEGFNPSILVVITRPSESALRSTRTLHVLALPQITDTSTKNKNQSVHTLTTLQIPWSHMESPETLGEMEYNLQPVSGLLYELADGYLTTFDLTASVAHVKSRLFIEGTTFIPLSSTSIVSASNDTMSIYHPVFRSIQASIDLISALESDIRPKKRKLDRDTNELPNTCRLVGHSTKHGVVVAISGTNLLSFQIDARRDNTGRPRSLGLLMDCIGCGVLNSDIHKPAKLEPLRMSSIGKYIPGSTDDIEALENIEQLDTLLEDQQVDQFEKLLSKLVGLGKMETFRSNGIARTQKGNNWSDPNDASWIWPKKQSEYPQYDPIWVQYTISRIFSWSNARPTEQMRESVTTGEYRLHLVLFPSNVINWLIQTGNMNKISITSALQGEIRASDASEIPAGQIVKCLVEIDPEMNLLLSLISSTYLEADELLHAIRLLMDSLGIFGDKQEPQPMLTMGDRPQLANGDVDAEIEFEENQADADLQLAEYRLGDGSSIRHQALSLALAKLYSRPSAAVIKAVQSVLTLSEIVSLIYLLRFELAGGSWTSRYLDIYQSVDGSSPPDSAIVLISTLLGRCIDAVGAGGWLSGDAMLVNGDHFESEELISSLKLEVSAALEGIEEATYLRGLTAEMLKFAESTSKATLGISRNITRNGDKKPTLVKRAETQTILPMGLKVDQRISLLKVGAGGELYARSMRDIGRLKSKKVGKYERERIIF